MGPAPLTSSPRDISVVANASRQIFGAHSRPLSKDRSASRTPQDIQGTLRKSRSQVPRPPQANDPRPGATSQRSPRGRRVTETNVKAHKEQSRTGGTLNSTPNVQTGQNRLSRHQVARTFVHTTYGDIKLIQILVVQAFQIDKLIGHRRSDASSIKSQALSGFSLNRMGPTAQPSQTTRPRFKPKISARSQATAWPPKLG
ncbi:hypothetical protein CRG98_019969 [Punica granatum]|uniref:Uncharacterized protein n=1 Tax=Punica granatum TaxID=22663 RepID=A0A2I0JTP4_PUNGR|nr:hypothetical protein CRG98_019969 [Punica granatum]